MAGHRAGAHPGVATGRLLITQHDLRHAVRCPLLSGHHGCEERDNWRTDSRRQVGRAGIRHDDDIRSAENGGQFRERQLTSKITSSTTGNEARQRGLICRPRNNHAISGRQQRGRDCLAVCCRGAPGRNRGTRVHHHVPCRAYASSDVGQRVTYCEPGTQFVRGKAGGAGQRKAAFGLRQISRYAMPQIDQRARVVLRSSRASGSGDW